MDRSASDPGSTSMVSGKSISAALLILAWAYLLWVAGTLTVEYYDGLEYILTGSAAGGVFQNYFPKSPFLSSLFAVVHILVKGREPSLAPFHLVVALANMAGLLAIAAWIRRYCPALGLLEIAAALTCNRLTVHYMPFTMSDLPSSGLIGLWLWTEAAWPLSSRRGRVGRAAALSLCVLGRVPIALIPAVSLLVEAWRSRQPRAAVEVGLGGLIATLAAIGAYYSLVRGTGFFAGIAIHLSGVLAMFRKVATPLGHSPWHYLPFFSLLLTPMGLLLLLLGFPEVLKSIRSRSHSSLLGPALGGLCFIAFMCVVVKGSVEARYLSPLLPFWALIQCWGVAWLAGKRPWARTLAIAFLFAAVAPEFWHFTQPFYRADLERKMALEIKHWSRSPGVVFLSWHSASMAPEKNVFHREDNYFYIYHWSLGAYTFFARQPASVAGPVSFSRYGYPIPDRLQDVAGPGATIIAPAEVTFVTKYLPARRPPFYALRWFPKDAGASECSAKVPELCVQVLAVDPNDGKVQENPTLPEKEFDAAALMGEGLKDLYERNDPVQAQAFFREVLGHNPAHYGATFQLAVALDKAGRRAEARPLWKKALAMAEGYRDQATADRARSRLRERP